MSDEPTNRSSKGRRGLRRALLPLALAAALAMPFLGIASAAECEGDDCQAPPPAPEEVIPSTSVVNGPGNPPVRFEGEKAKPAKPKHKHPKKPGKKR